MPDAIRLIPPSPTVHASYLDASAELRATHGQGTHWPGYDVVPGQRFSDAEVRTPEGFARFAAATRAMADHDRALPAGYVHDTRLWLVDEAVSPPTFLGRISIRHELTRFLRDVGGHIGYVVRPSARRHGLATRMLAEALPVAADLGLNPVLITCDDDNLASAKVILANGGSEDVPFERKRRFWLATRRLDGPSPAELLERQWGALRIWLGRLEPADLSRASVLDGWTVADLLAHLVRSFSTLPAVEPAPADVAPLTLNRYVSGYAAAAADIAEGTRVLAGRLDEPLAALDRAWAAVPSALAALDDGSRSSVVRAPRGPVRLADFVLSRVIELVVHADDLARSLGADAPLLPAAVAAVAGALEVAARERTSVPLRPPDADDLAWIRLACGRVDEPATADAQRAAWLPLL